MKKAKVILTSLVVLAVVGGALAFKAKQPVYCLYTTVKPGAITCPKAFTIQTTVVAQPNNSFQFATTRPILNCPTAVPTADCKFALGTIVDEP